MMRNDDSRGLLAEALKFLNERSRFCVRRSSRLGARELASRIEAYLERWEGRPHPAIAIAQARWDSASFIRVATDERDVECDANGYWVRSAVRVAFASVGEVDPAVAASYARALKSLSDKTRAIWSAHQQGNLSYDQIAARFDLTRFDVETHIAEALLSISRAMAADSAG